MTGFDPDWLALREPVDAASRAAELVAQLVIERIAGTPAPHTAPASAPEPESESEPEPEPEPETAIEPKKPERERRIVDLGAGTGANLRYLAPRIGGRQRWLLVDNDPNLFGRLPAHMNAWAATYEAELPPAAAEVAFRGPGFDARAQYALIDLAARFDAVPFPPGSLVTASALLDLVSAEWLRTLALRCAEAGSWVLLALTYDGRIECDPVDPEDAVVRDLVNRHQRKDKGFGPALGPAATACAAALFEELNYIVRSARSDWHLGLDHAALQRALLEGWLVASREMAPERVEALEAWHRRRLDYLEDGRSTIVVGHLDLIGMPEGARAIRRD